MLQCQSHTTFTEWQNKCYNKHNYRSFWMFSMLSSIRFALQFLLVFESYWWFQTRIKLTRDVLIVAHCFNVSTHALFEWTYNNLSHSVCLVQRRYYNHINRYVPAMNSWTIAHLLKQHYSYDNYKVYLYII